MKTAVRYYSKRGNTKTIAEAIAAGANVAAISVTDEPQLAEPVDILFLGGAPYANIMAKELRTYAEGLQKNTVGRVVLFTTSNWSRRTVLALRKLLREKGIPGHSRCGRVLLCAYDPCKSKMRRGEGICRRTAGRRTMSEPFDLQEYLSKDVEESRELAPNGPECVYL